MNVFHYDFGWGNIIGHDIDKKTTLVDFSTYPDKNKNVKLVKSSELKNVQETFDNVALGHGFNPYEFSISPITVQRKNPYGSGYITSSELGFVPTRISKKVVFAIVDDINETITFYDINNNELLLSKPRGYDDRRKITAFLQ